MARVELSIQIAQQGYWVPVSALSEDTRGIWSVYTLEDTSSDGSSVLQPAYQVVRRTIDIIHTESAHVFVQGLLEEHYQVITEGLQKIVPGQLVQLSTSLTRSDTNHHTRLEQSHDHR